MPFHMFFIQRKIEYRGNFLFSSDSDKVMVNFLAFANALMIYFESDMFPFEISEAVILDTSVCGWLPEYFEQSAYSISSIKQYFFVVL